MLFLVIGGAGYIGSHLVIEAQRQGHECIVFDNLSRGHRNAVPLDVPFVKADILDASALADVFQKYPQIDAIFHFAAFALVGESVSHPDLYYQNNTEGVRVLLDAMRLHAPRASLIFSSSCAVFGIPERLPICEDDRKNPINPYGRSKLMAEWIIEDYVRAFGLRAAALRYFNACGADPSGRIGEDHQPETHLIPNILRSGSQDEELTIFGNDFPTVDGTCVRDYIHVQDLADAHIRAAIRLSQGNFALFEAIHLGTGKGYSNLEILTAAEIIFGKKLTYRFGPRRVGDPPSLYADNRKARELLGFIPQFSSLENILTSALAWHQLHPKGFGDG